jgi:hypothetical protein
MTTDTSERGIEALIVADMMLGQAVLEFERRHRLAGPEPRGDRRPAIPHPLLDRRPHLPLARLAGPRKPPKQTLQ